MWKTNLIFWGLGIIAVLISATLLVYLIKGLFYLLSLIFNYPGESLLLALIIMIIIIFKNLKRCIR